MLGRLPPMADICWKRTSQYCTRCPGCGIRCRAEKGHHHERTDCKHFIGVMSAPQACLLTPGRGEEIVAQASANIPESRDLWHLFRIPYRGH